MIIMPAVESQGFMYLRKVYVLAWALALFCNALFAVIINALAFRKINKVPLTDITKY
jgi:putative ABC transport system permease protein